MSNKIKLALLNIMPNAIEYESLIRLALEELSEDVSLHPVRLATHQYLSSGEDIARYPTFDELIADVTPDLLIITGAPVEHLAYQQIHYWQELCAIIAYSGQHLKSVMGICFGGLAVAKYLGVDKAQLDDKLFGVLPVRFTQAAAPYAAAGDATFHLPLSTWALLDRGQLNAALGNTMVSMVEHASLGPLVLESRDRRFCMVLGHPEYRPATLRQEWERDCGQDLRYTRRFQSADFDTMAQRLADHPTALLARWVSSHAAQLQPIFAQSDELITP